MSKLDRSSKSGTRDFFTGQTAASNGLNSMVGAWHPGARIAVFLMLGVLCGADIWIFTAAKISSLPQVQVNIDPAKMGQV